MMRAWNNFLPDDAKAILATPIPQYVRNDKMVWNDSTTGVYTAKDGYRFWFN